MNHKTDTFGQKFARFLKGELGLLMILLLLCVAFANVSPFFLVERNLLNITRQVSIVLTVAMGMLCVVRFPAKLICPLVLRRRYAALHRHGP